MAMRRSLEGPQTPLIQLRTETGMSNPDMEGTTIYSAGAYSHDPMRAGPPSQLSPVAGRSG